MSERRLRDLRTAILAIDRETETIEARLGALAQPLKCASEDLHHAFAALPGTARAELARAAGSGGGERARLLRRYRWAEQVWGTLACEERRLRARRTELMAQRHEAVMEHRILYQRLQSLRVVEAGVRERQGGRTLRRAG